MEVTTVFTSDTEKLIIERFMGGQPLITILEKLGREALNPDLVRPRLHDLDDVLRAHITKLASEALPFSNYGPGQFVEHRVNDVPPSVMICPWSNEPCACLHAGGCR